MVGMSVRRGPGPLRPGRPTRALVALLGTVVAVVVAGCGSSSDSQDGNNVETLPPATAAPAPPAAERVGGITVPVPAGSTGLTLSGTTVGALAPGGTGVLRVATGSPTAPPSTSPTPRLVALHGVGDGSFVGVGPGVVARIDPAGGVSTGRLGTDDPLSVATTADGRILVGTADGHVLVLDNTFRQVRDIDGFVRVDDITVAPTRGEVSGDVGGQVVVLDRAQSSVTPVDLETGTLRPALRAGNGATNATVDRFGRVLVANTRDEEIVGFFGSPLVMRFRYPVPGSPYAVDYDDGRGLLWVSTTENNEVVAYDLATGEPIEKQRVTTVGQPDSIAVDDTSGTVYVLSGRDGALQIVAPQG